MSERRRYERKPVTVPVNVSTRIRRDRVGVTRDLSASGVLFHSVSKFEPGENVVLMFKVNKRHGSTTGRVVRSVANDNADTVFRYLTAVCFDAPLLDLELA